PGRRRRSQRRDRAPPRDLPPRQRGGHRPQEVGRAPPRLRDRQAEARRLPPLLLHLPHLRHRGHPPRRQPLREDHALHDPPRRPPHPGRDDRRRLAPADRGRGPPPPVRRRRGRRSPRTHRGL
ncbi:hypothetical protein LTR94_032618, partial [Friedmanniomyces endolithicus]